MAELPDLELAKQQLGILDDTSRDDLIAAKLASAIAWVENRSGHVLQAREFTDSFGAFGRYLELTKRPVTAVASITYTDSDGADAVYADFVDSLDRYPARIYPALNGWWPTLGTNGRIIVTYTAGHPADDIPAGLQEAVLVLVGGMFSQREGAYDEALRCAGSLCDQVRAPGL